MLSNVIPIEPESWERGCAADPVRNKFVVPTVVELLEFSQARRVLDVGCGTGYVARNAASRSSVPATSWTLIDSDPRVLSFASQHRESIPNAEYVNAELHDYVTGNGRGLHDLAIVSYTVLEVMDLDLFAASLRMAVPNGIIAIFVPDVIPDIIAGYPDLSGHDAPNSKRTGIYPLNKIDHFTGEAQTFLARQGLDYVSAMISSGTRLERITFYSSPSGGRHFGLIFRSEVGL